MPSLFVILGIKIKQEQTQRIVKILQKILAKKKAELACLGERHTYKRVYNNDVFDKSNTIV